MMVRLPVVTGRRGSLLQKDADEQEEAKEASIDPVINPAYRTVSRRIEDRCRQKTQMPEDDHDYCPSAKDDKRGQNSNVRIRFRRPTALNSADEISSRAHLTTGNGSTTGK